MSNLVSEWFTNGASDMINKEFDGKRYVPLLDSVIFKLSLLIIVPFSLMSIETIKGQLF